MDCYSRRACKRHFPARRESKSELSASCEAQKTGRRAPHIGNPDALPDNQRLARPAIITGITAHFLRHRILPSTSCHPRLSALRGSARPKKGLDLCDVAVLGLGSPASMAVCSRRKRAPSHIKRPWPTSGTSGNRGEVRSLGSVPGTSAPVREHRKNTEPYRSQDGRQ